MDTIDQWAGLDHKTGIPDITPEWAPADEATGRRLNFYHGVSAYLETDARGILSDDPNDPDRADEWREFGDAAVVIARIAAAVIGDEPLLTVADADMPLPDSPPIESAPEPPAEPEGDDGRVAGVLQAAYDAMLDVWVEQAEGIIETWQAAVGRAASLQERQRWLRRWADDEQFWAKLTENETENVVPFGDGCYVLGWDAKSRRPSVAIYEPDAYYPDLTSAEPGDFPTVVRLAWGFVETDTAGEEVSMVRIIKYELVPLEGLEAGNGDIPTSFAYRPEGYQPDNVLVVSDGVWIADEIEDTIVSPGNPARWNTVSEPGAGPDADAIELNQRITNLDFIPVVHIPNTLASLRHFGRSSLSRLFQLFDEIAANDTEEGRAAKWAGRPPIALSGFGNHETATIDLSPGKAVRLPGGGRLDQVNMSANLEKIMARGDGLLNRLSVNGQVPAGLLGRVDASEVPSGLALTLSFTPFEQMVRGLRMARRRKYRLLLDMVQRIAIANGDETLGGSTEVLPANVEFGSFMPQDLAGSASIISLLQTSRTASTETRVAMAQEAGVPIEDAEREVAAIKAEDGATAEAITNATDNPKYGANHLGIENYQPFGAEAAPDSETAPVVPAAAQVG